jgi:hypothetical protein
LYCMHHVISPVLCMDAKVSTVLVYGFVHWNLTILLYWFS